MKKKNRDIKRRWSREHPRVGGYRVSQEASVELKREDFGEELLIRLIEHSVDTPPLPEMEEYYAARKARSHVLPLGIEPVIVDDVDMGNDIQEEEEEKVFPRQLHPHTKRRPGRKYRCSWLATEVLSQEKSNGKKEKNDDN